MALLEVLKFPDQRLREVSKPVTEVTDAHRKLVEDMLETMYAENGIGLAAPQVAQLIRLVVIDTRPRDTGGRYEENDQTELEAKIQQPLILFNPEIVSGKGKTIFNEGCLSVPSFYEEVERFEKVRVRALGKNGQQLDFETDGVLAVCIQHEMDHLEGKLFIDRISFSKSSAIKDKIKKVGYPEKKKREPVGAE